MKTSRVIILLAGLLFSNISQAALWDELFGGNGKSSGYKAKIGLGYGIGGTWDVKPVENVTYFDKMRSFWWEIDHGRILSVHYGLRFSHDNSARIVFNGGPQRGEVYYHALKIGLKLTAPLGFFQPYVGGGVMGGWITLSNPADRSDHNINAAFNNQIRGARALYVQGGVDLMMFGDDRGGGGLRLAYQIDDVETNPFGTIQNKKLYFRNSNVYALFVFGAK